MRILILVAMLITAVHARDIWVMGKIKSMNYDSTQLMILEDAIRQEISIRADADVFLLGKTVEKSVAARKEAAESIDAVYGVSGTINRLSDVYLVSMDKWNRNGAVRYQQRISIPANEDVDALVKRIAECLCTEKEFTVTASTGTIMLKESIPSKRKSGSLMLVARSGMLYPFGTSFRVAHNPNTFFVSPYTVDDLRYDEGSAFGLEAGFGYDLDWMMFEATMGFDGQRDLNFAVSCDYPFSESDIAPYAGGEIGVMLVNRADDDDDLSRDMETNSDGIMLGGRAGIMLMRNHKFKLLSELRFITVFNKGLDSGIRFSVGTMIM